MKYLFTYKNGKKALGLSTINRGLAIKAGNTTVYPLLVSPSAANASCVRMKVNNEIKSIAYVPSLIIPGVLCGKSGSTYTDPVGIYFVNKFYKECFYDTKHGQYIAHSHYRSTGGTVYDDIAISVDGINWVERSIASADEIQNPVFVNTKLGVVVCMPKYNRISQYRVDYTVDVYIPYSDGNNVQLQSLYTLSLFDNGDIDDTFTVDSIIACSNGDNSIIIGFTCSHTSYGYGHFFQKVWNINLDTNAITVLVEKYNNINVGREGFISSVCFNRILGLFYYTKDGVAYASYNGVNFFEIEGSYRYSYGNLNGAEVFADGISWDGVNIAQAYSYRPNAYDPIEGKYIRVETGWTSQGGSVWDTYYFDIYESTDLINWTFVARKYNYTSIYPQTLTSVNTDGFACVKGF